MKRNTTKGLIENQFETEIIAESRKMASKGLKGVNACFVKG